MKDKYFASESKFGHALALYESYRTVFIQYMMREFRLEKDFLEDIYQDSFLVLFDAVKKGTFRQESSSMKSFLITTGRNQILNHLRSQRNMDEIDKVDEIDKDKADSLENREKQQIVSRYVSKMEEPCCTILSLYYYEEKSMVEIAEEMSYKNASVAKSRKSECMSQLRKKLTNRFKKEDLL